MGADKGDCGLTTGRCEGQVTGGVGGGRAIGVRIEDVCGRSHNGISVGGEETVTVQRWMR